MGYTVGNGPKGLDTFNDTPQTVADLNRLVALIARGANFRVGTQAQRNALTGAELFNGLFFVESDTRMVWVRENGGWRNTDHTPTNRQIDTTNSVQNTITQIGVGRITGNNTVQITEIVTFPKPFAATPSVQVSAAGYRATGGAFNDTNLSASTNFATHGVKTAAGFMALITQSGGTLSSGIDWYYEWTAIGVPA